MRGIWKGALVMSLLVAGVTAAAGAEPRIPDTPAGHKAKALLEAFRSGDAARLRETAEQHFAASFRERVPVEEHVRRQRGLLWETGGFDLLRAESSGEHEVALTVRTRLTEETLRLTVRVEPQPPHGITGLGARPAEEPGAPAKQLSGGEMAAELERYLEKLAKADRFSGAALVAKDGKLLFRKAYGLASRAFQAPNRVDTKFNLGSMNKMFTAVCIAQLVEAGKLSYQDPVGKHLPDFPNKDVREKVTLHHLLTHTSGIGDYFNEKFMQASRDRFRTVKDYLPLFQDQPLQFEPGARFSYSNAGFMLLGAVIEKVAGQSYFDYVRDHLYRPAGMVNTDAYEMDVDTPNLAIGYTREGSTGDEWRNNLYLHVIKGGPAGGGFSTVEDLLRFDQALRRHEAVSAKQVEALFAGKVATPPRGHYAYGFISEEVRGGRVVGHSGGFPGINSQLDMYLDSGYTVAVMSNCDMGAQPVINKLRRLLPTR